MNTGNRIKERRLELGLSINELARRLDVAPSTILRYETSNIRNCGIDKVSALAVALQCDPGYIIGWQDSVRVSSSPDPELQSFIKSYNALDSADQNKVRGFIDALLLDEKYQKKTAAV